MRMRDSGVSSRKASVRAGRAAARAASEASLPSSTSASSPMTRISSRSTWTSGGPTNQPSARRPAKQPWISSAGGGGAMSLGPGAGRRRAGHDGTIPPPLAERSLGAAVLALVVGDITAFAADAIVNAANSALRGGGGVDGGVHRRGGPAIMAELRARYPAGTPTGTAVATGAGDLPARWVVHAVGPAWAGGRRGERGALG